MACASVPDTMRPVLVIQSSSRPSRRQPQGPPYVAKLASGVDVVITLLTIPFVGVLVCAAHALADGAQASTISQMVTTNRDMEIVFGIAMGASALSISLAMWILKWRIVGSQQDTAYKFCPSLFLVLTILMIFGCGALARHTLKDDAGSHMLYAAMAFVSQLLMLILLDVAACTTCNLRRFPIRRPCVISAIVFTSLAVLMLILFALGDHVTSKSYYFEFALISCMYIASCSLAWENWSAMHSSYAGTTSGSAHVPASVYITQRPSTRFEAV